MIQISLSYGILRVFGIVGIFGVLGTLRMMRTFPSRPCHRGGIRPPKKVNNVEPEYRELFLSV